MTQDESDRGTGADKASYMGKEDGALASELGAAKRVYSALCNLDPSAAERVCQWAFARRSAEAYRLGDAGGLVGASLTQKSYRGL